MGSFGTIAVGILACMAVAAMPLLYAAWAPPLATRAQYERLKPGMDADGIVRTVGSLGEPAAAEEIEGRPRQTLTWINPDGSTLSVVLEQGLLVSKAEERLR